MNGPVNDEMRRETTEARRKGPGGTDEYVMAICGD